MTISAITAATTRALPQRSVGVLLGHCRNVVGETVTSSAGNLGILRRNAMMLSGAIQITSRILVANATAAKTRGTPEGFYRFQEAANTTFREVFAWCATYVLLLYAQRLIVDFFRSLLWVKGGAPFKPTMFQPILQGLFNVPTAVRNELAKRNMQGGAGLFSSLGGHIKDFTQGTQKLLPARPKLPPLFELKQEFLDVDLLRRRAQYRSIEPLVNAICHLAGKKPSTMIPAEKMQVFFNWAPPVLGSIPAILISGYGSESLTQRYARRMANKISNFASKEANNVPAQKKVLPQPAKPEEAVPYEPTVAASSLGAFRNHYTMPVQPYAMTQTTSPWFAPVNAVAYNPYAQAFARTY